VSDGEVTRPIWNITKHPNFNEITGTFDVALVSLASPATLSSMIGVVCLPSTATLPVPLFAGTELSVSGWQTFDYPG
jgi:Trypsin